MDKVRLSNQWMDLLAASLLTLVLAGCGGGGGGGGSAGGAALPTSTATTTAALTSASSLNMTITGVTINSPPVVNFIVTDQSGTGMTALSAADLRFNIAKLMPDPNGGPSRWQNYINRAVNGAVQGSQERSASGFAYGTLVNHGDGSYTYTFATDIRDSAKNPCPAPCTDAAGQALDLSFQPGLTHRVSIQQSNSAYPKTAAVMDFVPNGGALGIKRDIVATAKCNECHSQLTAHGTRVDTKLCVTCHNQGSWVASSGKPNVTVDFKVMIHKLHNASALPSVLAGTPYLVNNTDFSKAAFPQDVRNCTKCHDGTPGAANTTAQGDNWKKQPSMEACGSCHDDVYFGTSPDPAKPYQTVAHPGGVMTDNSGCPLCHAAGRFLDNKDIVVAHSFPAKLKTAAAKFEYKIISATPTAPNSKPVVTFSVTDPTSGGTPYDIKTAAAFTATGASLSIRIGWSATDFNNDNTQQNFGQPLGTINALTSAVAGAAAGTFTVTSPVAIPAAQTGTLRVMIYGHPNVDVDADGITEALPVKSAFKDLAITTAADNVTTATPRRSVVDVAKCNVCHDVLSLHGTARTNEPGICVICHNPNATDKARRPTTSTPVDGKAEESIDFKRMIHGIHAGQADKGGFRTKGLVVYGFTPAGQPPNPVDFSNVVFPGVLSNCNTCHVGNSYQLSGTWATPKTNGILGSTIDTGASATDPADNVRITPTAAVCTSCHDGSTTVTHILNPFGFTGGSFTDTNGAAPEEDCSRACHGPGGFKDISVVHKVK